jgi:hypothetical protein
VFEHLEGFIEHVGSAMNLAVAIVQALDFVLRAQESITD